MENENSLFGNKDQKEIIITTIPDIGYNPADFRYHPEMTKLEIIAALDYERGRFFREWGNV